MSIRFSSCFCLSFLLIIACSKDNNTGPATPDYVKATGDWSSQNITDKGESYVLNYNAITTPCLSDNKYEFNTGATGRYYYAGSDTCYLFQQGSLSVISGIPGDDDSFTWQQKNDTVFISYNIGGRDTGILSNTGGEDYLTITNHASSTKTYTIICKR
ncbi:hypothetical protein FRZ67_16950 [Panacibacter ginsenosidivorans]|uniref:Lipocalin-like domain-containing protein n=1 Tax=Panacibacter ginsenosidivorans TaxID=1813871 RepID=A0A5B8VBV7_9BACT|nr:hypothetical protein [Panacibacter ginsenosidivorans]QEC68914.1 hypothetical protein FRZ67_16950 [Panacibacter ginsenosidivorans]